MSAIAQRPNWRKVEQTQITEQARQTIPETESEVRKDVTKVIKKLMKFIRRQLLKIDWFSREVEAYLLEQKIWARILRGGTMRL